MFDYSSSLENNKMLTNSSLNVRLFECFNVDITSNMFRGCHRPNKLDINIMIVGSDNYYVILYFVMSEIIFEILEMSKIRNFGQGKNPKLRFSSYFHIHE